MDGYKITNLRMEEGDYLQAKVAAAELGMSLNAYFNFLSRTYKNQAMFFNSKTIKRRKVRIIDLPDLAVKFKKGDEAEWSEADRIVYDH